MKAQRSILARRVGHVVEGLVRTDLDHLLQTVISYKKSLLVRSY